MKKLVCILFFFASVSYGQSVLSGQSIVLDSLAANPSATNSLYQTKIFLKSASPNGVGVYAKHRNAIWRIDSSYAFADTARAFQRIATQVWENLTAVDSLPKILVPNGRTITIDSVYVTQVGASALTFNIRKVHSGSSSDIISTNWSPTSSILRVTGMQNNTSIPAYDQIWISIRSITGTCTYFWVEIVYHYTA